MGLDASMEATIARIRAEGPEATIDRLHRQLDLLPAKLRRLDRERRAIALAGLEESISFWGTILTRDVPSPPPSPVIDFAERRERLSREGGA